jgi:hypothetical protein
LEGLLKFKAYFCFIERLNIKKALGFPKAFDDKMIHLTKSIAS